jgi:hypothetical protein
MTQLAITQDLQLGEPTEHRGVVIAPLFPRRSPVAEYFTLDEALELGFVVSEVSDAGTVPELVVENPLAANVLLYDGEELVGAKQNRILNVTVLAGAKSTLRIPVSCVEQGRWSHRAEAFDTARHLADPELRRRKNERLAEQPLERGAAQYEVWNAVEEKAMRLGAYSPTAAHADTFAARERDLAELRGAFPVSPGQCGAVLALDGSFCLDTVSRPEAFGRLYPKLRDGYLLDALELLDTPPADGAMIDEFVGRVQAASVRLGPSPGLGADVRLRGAGVVGSGLELEGELIQLTAFSATDDVAGRIARPSRRLS